jgi:glycosyltransferase involved in cell wall biosynthesis
MPSRLLIAATHPVQYHAPLFRALAKRADLDLTVGFLDLPDAARQGVGFGQAFTWDIPLLDGYHWVQLDARVQPGERSQRFAGRSLINARGQLRQLAPDVVLVMGWNQLGLLQAWLAARLQGIPLIVRGESNARRRRPAYKRWLHRLLLGVPNGYVAIGKSNRDFYLTSGVPADHIVDGPYFVDNADLAARAGVVDRGAVRAGYGIDPRACCVLFAGKFEPKKRPGDLIAAVAALKESAGVPVHLLMVGSGELEQALRAQADACGIPVSWAGFLNQSAMPRAYRAADVLVLPSDHGETWGLVCNEAAACAVPAIVGDQVGCADDLVVDGSTGWVFPTGDVRALARCIAEAASAPAMRADRGRQAKARVFADYTVERSADAVAEVVASMLGKPHPNASPRAANP